MPSLPRLPSRVITVAKARSARAIQAGSRSAPPAWASARIISPFHEAMTFSSRSGFTRISRIKNRRARARAKAAISSGSVAVTARDSTQAPVFASPGSSKFPSSVTPKQAMATSAASGSSGSAARISSSFHTKNFPSCPSLSASCVA